MVSKKDQSDQTINKILSAAFTILKTSGVRSLTSVHIVKTAGISKGGFFHHFPQIEDFYVFMLDYIIQSFAQVLNEKKHKDYKSFLRSSVEQTFKMMDEAPEIFTAIYYFMDQARFNQDYAARLKSMINKSLEIWTAELKQYFPAEFPHKKMDSLMCIIDMYFAGLGVHYLVMRDRKKYKNITNEFVEMIILYVGRNAQ